MEDILARISMYAGTNNATTTSTSTSTIASTSASITTSTSVTKSEFASKDVIISNSSLGIICFSKDRPYQLDQLLESIKKSFADDIDRIKIIVIYKYSEERWKSMYDVVFSNHPTIMAVLETNFYDNLASSLQLLDDLLGVGFICFCVDDLIFLKNVSIKQIASLFSSNDRLYSLHLKLHPGIVYSHAGSRVCDKPVLLFSENNIGNSCLQFLYSQGSTDWRYPFDLCAGVYRYCDVSKLMAESIKLYGPSHLANPNLLEHTGNIIFWKSMAKQYSYGACMSCPTTCVVTVNCVQTVFKVPIYDTIGGDLESLNHLLASSTVIQYDIPRYELEASMHVHVGSLYFNNNKISPPLPTITMVSVLVPVFNGEMYILSCMKSLLESKQQCIFELIIVDDGSTDKTIEIINNYLGSYEGAVKVNLVKSKHVGLIGALEIGLNCISDSVEFVARLDCDDLCWDGRLDKQLRYLVENSDINVVGSQAILLSNEVESAVASGIPSNKYLLAWTMMFRCCVLHPTVMFRKKIIHQCLSYSGFCDPKTECVEDYDLWMRVLERYPYSITNLPDVFVSIRRHAASKSRMEIERLCEGSQFLQAKAINNLLECDSHLVDVILLPQMYLDSTDIVTKAILTISNIYDAFKEKIPAEVREDRELIALLDDSKTKLERELFRCAVSKYGSAACVGLIASDHQSNVLKDMLIGHLESGMG